MAGRLGRARTRGGAAGEGRGRGRGRGGGSQEKPPGKVTSKKAKATGGKAKAKGESKVELVPREETVDLHEDSLEDSPEENEEGAPKRNLDDDEDDDKEGEDTGDWSPSRCISERAICDFFKEKPWHFDKKHASHKKTQQKAAEMAALLEELGGEWTGKCLPIPLNRIVRII